MAVNIKARINARKILFYSYYQYYFFLDLLEKESILREITLLDDPIMSHEEFDLQLSDLKKAIHEYISQIGTEESIPYMIDQFLPESSRDLIDIEFILPQFAAFRDLEKSLPQRVDSFATTFLFEQMDNADKALFLLGYVEYMVMKTEKDVILNELVEMGKRFGDKGTKKLINGIMHHVLLDLEAKK